jgi:hypothetical protein
MKTEFTVTDEHKATYLSRLTELNNRFLNGSINPSLTLTNLQLVIEGAELSSTLPEYPKWILDILDIESKYHLAFFGQEFDLTEFANTLKKYGQHKFSRWSKLGLEPHYLPKVSMMAGDSYLGWKIKPNQWFYQQQIAGNFFCKINGQLQKVIMVALGGETVLIDVRKKPVYQDGKQMYAGDNLLGPIIKQLREQEKIENYNPVDSRFNVSANETDIIKPLLAEKLGLQTNQIRSEFAIEGNIIPQLYTDMPRKDDGQTNTWVWYEEGFEGSDKRLSGGYSDGGGLAHVDWSRADYHWVHRSVRFLAVL